MTNNNRQTQQGQPVKISQLEIPLCSLARQNYRNPDQHLHAWIASHCGIPEDDVLSYTIRHRSLDARRKPNLRLIYQLEAVVRKNSPVRESATTVVLTPAPDQNQGVYQIQPQSPLPKHPIIVGTGPAGMMAAYVFALHGCEPLVLDRGSDVEQRHADIQAFLHTRQLNPQSNYLFGEGGAGTYSDGKLYTRLKDPRIRFLLEAYVAARAPRRILYDHHPHIGSDILPHMVRRLRQQIEAWGGRFRWGATVEDLSVKKGRCQGVILQSGEVLEGPVTLIACGHSARAFIRRIVQHEVAHRLKDFQLGCRIEHPQALIDQAQYGWIPPRHLLGAAEYQVTSRPADKTIPRATTFCMCPGGEIIAATSDEGQLCTNGMSPFLRDGAYANAGLIVNQKAANFNSIFSAFEFLDQIEQQAFRAGAGAGADCSYESPAQSATAFVRGESGLHVRETSYRLGILPGRLDLLLPPPTTRALQTALQYFEKIIPGFMRSGTLIGVETRVSSPVRFERNPETLSSSVGNLYLAGEGAGYAGGITSAALDGIRIAETILTGNVATRKTTLVSS